MTPVELRNILKKDVDIQLLDVREQYEYQICKQDESLHIPIGQIISRVGELSKDKELVVLCHHGIRSAMVVNFLKKNGFHNVHNLDGGINRWAFEVEPEMPQY